MTIEELKNQYEIPDNFLPVFESALKNLENLNEEFYQKKRKGISDIHLERTRNHAVQEFSETLLNFPRKFLITESEARTIDDN